MRRALNEGIAVTLRWMVLVGLGLILASSQMFSTMLGILLGVGALWNAGLSLLLFSGRKTVPSLLTTLADLGLASGLFYVSRTLQGPLVWAGLLPIVGAAWTLGFAANLIIAIMVSLGFAAMAMIDVAIAEIPMRMLVPSAIFLGTALMMGVISRQAGASGKQGLVDEGVAKKTALREDDRVSTLLNVANALNSSLVFDQVLDLALDLGRQALNAGNETNARAVGGILLFDQGGLRLAAARGPAAKNLGRVLPGQQGALAELLQSGDPLVVAQPGEDAEFSQIEELLTCQSLYCSPLLSGTDLFGVMFFGHADADFFSGERRENVELVARQVMVALRNAQRYEALNEEKEQGAHIQEQARKQLARSMHDGPAQSVAAIAMRVSLARRLLSKDAGAASEELFKLEDLARRTTKEMRHMLFTLHPQTLETSGLMGALRDLVQQVEETYERKVQLDIDSESTRGMDLGRQVTLFYIAAEALTNAGKHAAAKNVSLRLGKTEFDVTLLEVLDDGIGFTQQEARAKRETDGALGLETLRERVELVHGVLRLESKKGQGTTVSVWTPLSEEAAERLRRE